MEEQEYRITQTKLIHLANIIEDMPLNDFLQAINHADTIGPIIDPTLWIKGQETMHEIETLASALIPFQQAAVRFIKNHRYLERKD